MALNPRLCRAATAVVVGLLFAAPYLGAPDFYMSYLYVVFLWVSLATSWGILSGYAGYWSFGHAAFFGAGMYTTGTLAGKWGLPFLLTVPLAAGIAALLATLIGLVVFRVKTLRGEFFALLTLSVTYVLAAIISNTPIDGGAGVFLSGVQIPTFGTSQPGALYLLGLVLAIAALAVSRAVLRSRLGVGLLAIHDDEDVAEVKGVPTLKFKIAAFALSSAIAGAVGAVQAVYVGYVTVGETFSINVPLYVVLMSILGGARHWAGPAIGATLITVALSLFVGSGFAELGRAGVALALIIVILLLPEGIVPPVLRRLGRLFPARPAAVGGAKLVPLATAVKPDIGPPLLKVRHVTKRFGGIHALRGVNLEVRRGEILALVGPNGSGKSTLINMISGHFPLSSGSIELAGRPIAGLPPHQIARCGIARTYQIPRLFEHLTVLENVRLCAAFGPDDAARGTGHAETDEQTAHRWLAFTGLDGKADLLPAALNLHERKFVEFARALAARPQLLLLDEVLCGLTPTEVDQAVAMIQRIRAGGTTIVFVEHLMRAVVALADRVAVLDQGALLALGAPRETMQNPQVVAVYLGTAHAA